MTFLYATDVAVPNKGAQAEQIRGMTLCLEEQLGSNFHLLCSQARQTYDLAMPTHKTMIRQPSLLTIIRRMKLLLALLRELRKTKYDVVYTRQIYIALASKLWSPNTRTTFEMHKPVKGYINKRLFQYFAKAQRTKVITITQSLQKYVQSTFEVHSTNHVRNAAYIDGHDSLGHEFEAVQIIQEMKAIGKQVICHTGSLPLDRGLDIFYKITEQLPNTVVVHVGGKQEDIQQFKNSFGATSQVVYITNIPKPAVQVIQREADYLLYMTSQHSDIFWCTSPNKVFEYIMANKPIIAPRIGSIQEVLSDENAILFNSVDELVKKLQNPSSRKKRVSDREAYTMQARVRKILEVLQH